MEKKTECLSMHMTLPYIKQKHEYLPECLDAFSQISRLRINRIRLEKQAPSSQQKKHLLQI